MVSNVKGHAGNVLLGRCIKKHHKSVGWKKTNLSIQRHDQKYSHKAKPDTGIRKYLQHNIGDEKTYSLETHILHSEEVKLAHKEFAKIFLMLIIQIN